MFRAPLAKARCVLTTSTIVLFVLALCAPRVDEFIRDAELRGPGAAEHRTPEPWPDPITGLHTARAWPGAFTRWYDDRMGLRDVLLRQKSLLYVQGFRASPSDLILIGPENFLFFRGNHTLEIHRGVRPLSTMELDRFRRWFEYRDAWCRARGMQYLLVIGPNKETLYPELLPDWCVKLGPSRLEQFRAHLTASGSPVELVDLVEPLRAARALEQPRRRLYSVLGTHWDGLGMWAAYHAVAKRLARDFSAVRPLALEELDLVPLDENPDSWARQMYIEDVFDPFCTVANVPPRKSRRSVVVQRQGHPDSKARSIVQDAALPRLWVNHDSFGLGVLDLLEEHASSATTEFAARFEMESIERSRANVVIDWYVERIFDYWTPAPDAMPPLPAPKPQAVERVAWRLDGERGLAGVKALGGARLEVMTESPMEFAIHMETTGDWIELPKIDIEGPGRPILRVRVLGPGATECDLFFRNPGAEYRRKDVRTASVPAMGSTIEFPLDRRWLDAPLRLRPGRLPGTYFVSELSIRLEEAAAEVGDPPR